MNNSHKELPLRIQIAITEANLLRDRHEAVIALHETQSDHGGETAAVWLGSIDSALSMLREFRKATRPQF